MISFGQREAIQAEMRWTNRVGDAEKLCCNVPSFGWMKKSDAERAKHTWRGVHLTAAAGTEDFAETHFYCRGS